MSDIRNIIEAKLKRLRIDRDKFIRVKNKTATNQRCSEIHILESVLEDVDEANEINTSASVLNIQNVIVSACDGMRWRNCTDFEKLKDCRECPIYEQAEL